jgi:hypothetical protein
MRNVVASEFVTLDGVMEDPSWTCRPRADGFAGSPRSCSMLALSPAHSTLVGPY